MFAVQRQLDKVRQLRTTLLRLSGLAVGLAFLAGCQQQWDPLTAMADTRASLANPVPATFAVADYFADHGGDADGQADATAALVAACEAAVRHGAGAVVQLPEGTLRVAPRAGEGFVFAWEDAQGITIRGAGRERSIVLQEARPAEAGGPLRDPADPTLTDGRGGFMRIGRDCVLTFEGFTVHGQAPPTSDAGKWPGVVGTGWDASHKAFGAWDGFRSITFRDLACRGHRGEQIYAGGGRENGLIVLEGVILRDCNASAISCTASMEISDLEVFDCYNGIENFLFPGHHFVMRDATIEPSRSFPYAKFGAVFLGVRDASIVIEDSHLEAGEGKGQNASGPLYFSEFCHNVTVRDTVLANGPTGAHVVGMSAYRDIRAGNGGFTNFLFQRVTYRADRRSFGCHYRYGDTPVEWVWEDCRFEEANGHHIQYLGQFPGGATGPIRGMHFISKVFEPTLFYARSQRPVFEECTFVDHRINVYHPPEEPPVLLQVQSEADIFINDYEVEVPLQVDPASLSQIPDGYRIRVWTRDESVELQWPAGDGTFGSARVEKGAPVRLQFSAADQAWVRLPEVTDEVSAG